MAAKRKSPAPPKRSVPAKPASAKPAPGKPAGRSGARAVAAPPARPAKAAKPRTVKAANKSAAAPKGKLAALKPKASASAAPSKAQAAPASSSRSKSTPASSKSKASPALAPRARSARVTPGSAPSGKASPVGKPASIPAAGAAADLLRAESLPLSAVLAPVHAVIENLQPTVDGGLFPVKAVPGETIEVTADIYRDGHDKVEAVLLYREKGGGDWERAPMRHVDNDQWGGSFTVDNPGFYEFTVAARSAAHAPHHKSPTDEEGQGMAADARPNPYAPKTREEPAVFEPVGRVRVDSPLAEHSAWYEMWAKSQGTDPTRSATFDDCIARLPEIKDMGFDVIYVPPIHPIGITARKGANNSVTAKPGEPGCPYAIGNHLGGHKAVDPELGTLEDCGRFIRACREMGFQVALDFALNCSPDHPYVKDHPDWFYREKDGTIKCAENPPKRYEDVYPLNYFCDDRENLWLELKSIITFWMEQGITLFRVDNPHTKPFAFWEWLIAEIKALDPNIVFLSEAFTRPKVMKRLAKIGFDLSYTYFTWRTGSAEIREYLEELTQGPESLYMKGIFFPTTPDILPWHLQHAPREMFMIRFALASTLVSAYGMYNGYEICENAPYPGKEEFLFSEKYQYKVWDWNRPGNIKGFIKQMNAIRRDHPCLRYYKNLSFHASNNPQILAYSKTHGDDTLLFVVNLDPHHRQGATLTLDMKALGLAGENIYGIYDLLTHESYVWSGSHNYVELVPQKAVLHVLKVEKF